MSMPFKVAATSIFDGVRAPALGGMSPTGRLKPSAETLRLIELCGPALAAPSSILDVRQRDCAQGRGDDGLLRLDPLVEFEAGGGQVLEQALELRLVAGEVGARRVRRKQAPKVEGLTALEAVDAKIDQRLFYPCAEIDRSIVCAGPRRLEADVGNVLLRRRRHRIVGAGGGRDRLLNGAEIDQLSELRVLELEGSLVQIGRAGENPRDGGTDQRRRAEIRELEAAARVLGVEGDFGKRIHGDPPIAVILLDRLGGDDGGIVGNAGFLDERVQRAQVGGDEIVGALGGHRHDRRGAGLERRAETSRSGLSAPPRPRAWPACRRRGREAPTAPRPATRAQGNGAGGSGRKAWGGLFG